MTRKINAKNVGVLALSTTALSGAFGLIGSYALNRLSYSNVDTGLNMALSWCLFHAPIIFTATDSLRQELGLKSPTTIIGNSFGKSKRKIPFSVGGKDSHIFMSSIGEEELELDSVIVNIDSNNYTLSLTDLEYFIRRGWALQRNGQPGLSRRYWLKNGLSPVQYQVRLNTIQAINGIIVDRGDRRSGKYAIPPSATMQAITTALL